MGTSSMYGGYGGSISQGNPLLPDDFDDNNGSGSDNDNIESGNNNAESNTAITSNTNSPISHSNVSWQSAKTAMSKISSGSSSNIKKAISTYVKAHGGAKNASRTAKSGVVTTLNIGSFINNVSSQGFRVTLEKYNIDYENKSAKEVLSDLINYLAPSPVTKEDSIARKALILTMEKLYEVLDLEIFDINKITAETLNFLIPKYIESYIYERLLNDLGSRIETADIDCKQAVVIETELKDYINAKVDIAFRDKDFTKIDFTKKEVESLYNQCYTVMEDII